MFFQLKNQFVKIDEGNNAYFVMFSVVFLVSSLSWLSLFGIS